MKGTNIIADQWIDDSDNSDYDLIVLPGGGGGAQNFVSSTSFANLLKKQKANGKYIAAICASPVIVLNALGLLEGQRATAYPSMQSDLPDSIISSDLVVVSNKIITS